MGQEAKQCNVWHVCWIYTQVVSFVLLHVDLWTVESVLLVDVGGVRGLVCGGGGVVGVCCAFCTGDTDLWTMIKQERGTVEMSLKQSRSS